VSYTAHFIQQNDYEVALHSNPPGGGTLTGGGSYDEGTEATVQANPATGYVFKNWTSGNDTLSSNMSFSFFVTRDTSLTAHFIRQYEVTLAANPAEGGTISGGGIYKKGIETTIQANPSTGFVFEGWISGGDTLTKKSDYTFVITQDVSLTAHFARQYDINASVSPTEGGTVSGSGKYKAGEEVTLQATPAPGYIFGAWISGGDTLSASATYSITATKDMSLVASFIRQNDYGVSLTANPKEGGTVSGGGAYNEGTTVNVEAIAADGFEFKSWTAGDDTLSVKATWAFVVSQDTSIKANFIQNQEYDVEVSSFPSEGGDISGGKNSKGGNITTSLSYDKGTKATLHANPAEGFAFECWISGGDTISTESTYSFTIDGDVSLTAHFIRQYEVVLTSNDLESGEVKGSDIYKEGTEAIIQAIPAGGYAFDGWTSGGDTISRETSYTFVVNQDVSLTAHFVRRKYIVKLSANPAEGGDVNRGNNLKSSNMDNEESCPAGTEMTLQASPADGYVFKSWTSDGDTLSTADSYTFTVNEDCSITGNFVKVVTSIDDLKQDDVLIFPNPAEHSIHIQGLTHSGYKLSIFGVNGIKALERVIKGTSASVNIDELKEGIYLVRIENESSSYTRKLIVR
jgi:hypothetical protein